MVLVSAVRVWPLRRPRCCALRYERGVGAGISTGYSVPRPSSWRSGRRCVVARPVELDGRRRNRAGREGIGIVGGRLQELIGQGLKLGGLSSASVQKPLRVVGFCCLFRPFHRALMTSGVTTRLRDKRPKHGLPLGSARRTRTVARQHGRVPVAAVVHRRHLRCRARWERSW